MPTFDIVSKVDNHELRNAVDQANREVDNRFDFKNSGAQFELGENLVTMSAPNDFQLQQMSEILLTKIAKRSIDVTSLEFKEPEINLSKAKQEVTIKRPCWSLTFSAL